MLGETAKLAIDLSLTGNASSKVGALNSQLGKLDGSAARLHKGFTTLGSGIGMAIRNGAILAGAGITALTGLIAVSIKEGQEAANVQLIYAKAIANSAKTAGDLKLKLADLNEQQRGTKEGSAAWDKLATKIAMTTRLYTHMGPVTAQQTALLNAQQTALMNLGGVDDELIKSEQTRLIQMGLNGEAVRKLTPLILDMSKATGRDLLTSTIAVGKAVNGNVAGLQKFGIVVDKTKAQVDPFAAVMDALNKKFGGTTKALSGQFDTRIGALRENLANIREDIGIKLLPSLTRIVDVVGRSLVPAFGKFVDRILPDISKGIDTFASALEGGGAENAIKGIADALGSMIDLLKIAAGPVKTIVSAFLSLPKEVQGILVGGFAINKLSGGLIGQGIGQIAKELIFNRGTTPANPLFVADVTGGLGGVAGAAGGAAAGTGLALVTSALAPAAVGAAALIISDQINRQGDALVTQTQGYVKIATDAELANAVKGVTEQLNSLGFNSFDEKNKIVAVLNTLIAEQNRRTTAGATPTLTGEHSASRVGRTTVGVQDAVRRAGERGDADAEKMSAILGRAWNNGKVSVTMTGIRATLAKNEAHARDTKTAADKTTAAVFAGAEKTSMRLLEVIGAIRTMTPTVNNYTGFTTGQTITVKATSSARDNAKSDRTLRRWGPVGIG